ncbi:MAG: hypothetical protein WCC55_07870 [Nitrosotalea sp.]
MEQYEIALISCIETVLMRRGNTNYILVLSKLDSCYNYKIRDCYDHPEYLKIILKEVYKENYYSIINEIRLELSDLAVEEIADFINIMLKL